jgi:signal transduction histidine kinase
VHETKGSGLGLPLVRHIMEAHGGSVEVESTPGKGSTFTLVLPVREQH